MSGKYRSKKEFLRIKDKFFNNCRAKGYPETVTQEVWRQIESFAGYSFSKAHSASYAVESFQSLYLKTYFPLEFQTAVLNNFGGFYHAWVYFNELTRQGGKLHLPCVNNSYYLNTIRGKDIFMGFVYIQGLEKKLSQTIVKEREKNGIFTSLENFITRTSSGKEMLILLIRAGAFRFTGKNKAALLWEAHALLPQKKKTVAGEPLFSAPAKQFTLPTLEYSNLRDAYDEIELFGFPVSMNAFDMLKTSFRGEVKAKQLAGAVGKTVRMVGRLVTVKYVKTVNKQLMHFATFIDAEGEFFDTVHFPQTLKRYPFQGAGIYLLLGKVVSEFGYASVEVQKLAKLPYRTLDD